MIIKGIEIPNENYSNTVNATTFALRYFRDLHQDTKTFSKEEGFNKKDIIIVSLPYDGNKIALGYSETLELLNTFKDIVLILMFIKDDGFEKDTVLKDDFISNLNLRNDVYVEHFTKMISDREIPLQTSDMMQIMDLCSRVYNKYQ